MAPSGERSRRKNNSFVDFALYKLFVCLLNFHAYVLPYLFTSLLIYFFQNRPVPFPGRNSETIKPGFIFCVFIICCCIFCYGSMSAFVVFDLVFQYLAKRLTVKNISEMTYFVSGGTR